MKKLIIVTMIAACVALCAAVWPHGNTVETPVPAAETAVSAKEATVAEIEKPAALAEKEKGTIPQQESPQEEQPEKKIGTKEKPEANNLQIKTKQTTFF